MSTSTAATIIYVLLVVGAIEVCLYIWKKWAA